MPPPFDSLSFVGSNQLHSFIHSSSPIAVYLNISYFIFLLYFLKYYFDTRVNDRYMNELRLYLNKSDHEDRMTKKCWEEMKVTVYTNNVHLSRRYVSEDKTCEKNSCWLVEIVFPERTKHAGRTKHVTIWKHVFLI